MKRIDSLEIDQDLVVERREWVAQRIGWVVFLLIILAGLAGILGSGPLSQASAASGDLAVTYERFARMRAQAPMVVTVPTSQAANGEVAIWVDRGYFDAVMVESVLPEPVEMSVSAGQVIYRFAVVESPQPVEITFTLRPDSAGQAQATVGLVDGPAISFSQMIYP